jgi:Lysylphosphatidylglycerol synthase TM region
MWLAGAAACYAAALLCCAGSWRSLLPAPLSLRDSLARYGVGSLANTVLPARLGDGVRVGLFARVVPGGALAVVGAVAAVGAVRWLALTPLGLVATAQSHVPRAALAAGAIPVVVAVVLARRGHLNARPAAYASAVAWIAGVVATRVLAAAAIGIAFGIRSPLAAALIVVPALELAGVVSLAPANLGIAGGAAALAFHTHGASTTTAVAAGFALHAVETGTALAVGTAGAVALGVLPCGFLRRLARLAREIERRAVSGGPVSWRRGDGSVTTLRHRSFASL